MYYYVSHIKNQRVELLYIKPEGREGTYNGWEGVTDI